MKAVGCLLLVVLEIIFFALIGDYMSHRNDVATKDTDSLSQVSDTADESTESTSDMGTYVGPYTDRNGRFHKGHVRKSYNLHPKAYQHRARSRYYNHTHIRKHSH